MRVLVVEDDDAVRAALRRALLLGGYDVVLAENGDQGLARAETEKPDVIVLDVRMPGIDGLQVCRTLRQAGDRTPILMLTARDAVTDRIEGLDAGADDYLVKPYDVGELQARVRALIRRTSGEGQAGKLTFAELELDPAAHTVTVGGRGVELTRTEFSLLELFMLNRQRVLSPYVIYDRVWGYDISSTANVLRVYVGYLRRKLEAAGGRRLIQTVHGVGYVLREP
jgi:two-component system, OmpR family, response regulator MprA